MDIIEMYLIAANLCGFAVMGVDKAKAKRGAWRIPEKTLFTVALLGGGIGVWLGMNTFRHKTKHWYFKYGIPAIVFIELFLVLYLTS